MKRKDWKTILLKIQKDSNAIILSEINDKITTRTIIYFRCKCGNEHKKDMKNIASYCGLYCKKCSIKISLKTRDKNNLEKYGVKNPSKLEEVKKKIRKTNIKKYGTEYGFQSKIIKEKIKKTNLEKYGVENQSQRIEIQKKQKSSCYHNLKKYTFNTGEIVNVRGYEPKALKLLELQGYTYNDIEIETLQIKYKYNDKNYYHYPDIYIPNENRIIEVKSDWTFKKENNIQKKISSIEQGYLYEFWIFDSKGKLTIL